MRGAIRRRVTLVAVSKTFGAEAIEPVIAAGQRVFGENRVQEAKAKWPPLMARYDGLELHLVGALQSNKAREAVALFDAIHSVDRASLAEALGKEIARQGRKPLLFVEINTGEEPQKGGVLPHGSGRFSGRLPGPLWPGDFGPDVHPAIRRAAGAAFCADGQDRPAQWAVLAVDGHERATFRPPSRFGATHVRVGTAIFGARRRLIVNHDSCFRAKLPSQHAQFARLERDAAGGRRKARPCHMDKDGAAPAGHARPRIVVDLDNEIVEAVFAPEPIAWFIGRAPKGPVVAPVARIFAPGVGAADPAHGQRGSRRRQPIRPPPQPQRAKAAARRTAIAFALVGSDAAAAERDRHAQGAGAEPALRWPAGPRPDMDRAKEDLCMCGAPEAISQLLLALVSSHALLRARQRSEVAAKNGGRAPRTAGGRPKGFEQCRTRAKF